MHVRTLGPLRVRTVVKAPAHASKHPEAGPLSRPGADAAALTVVLMHGYGAPGDDLVSMAGALDAPAGTTFVFPEAPAALPEAMGLGDGRAWWPIDVGRYERAIRQGTIENLVTDEPAGLSPARDAVVAMLDALESETTATDTRIVIGGFSQGSMLATDIALRTKRPLAGLAILSGTLLAATEWLPGMADRKGLRVFQSHGTEDPLLPMTLAQLLHHAMTDAGLEVSFTPFEGGHGIPGSVMRSLGQWLHHLP